MELTERECGAEMRGSRMSRIIEKKILQQFADAVLDGSKTFELRKNDEGYKKGDIIKFNVIDDLKITIHSHRLNGKLYEITYVLSGWGMQDGFVALSIKPYEERANQ